MKKASLLFLVQTGVIRSISVVRENTNGYPYCTIINNDGKVQNVYFGKRTAEKVAIGEKLSVDMLKQLEFVASQNANNEDRVKLSLPGESENYTDVAALLGVAQPTNDAEAAAAVVAALESQWTVGERQTVSER